MNVVVRLSPEGAYIYTIRVTVTSLSRSSKWVRWDGSLQAEGAQLSSIRHGMIQLDCGDLMPLSHCGSAVSAAMSQREGHRFHLGSLRSVFNLTILALVSVRCLKYFFFPFLMNHKQKLKYHMRKLLQSSHSFHLFLRQNVTGQDALQAVCRELWI